MLVDGHLDLRVLIVSVPPTTAGAATRPGSPPPPVLRLRDLRHRFGDTPALDGVSLDLRPGVTALVGVNGAGKTTLMHSVAGSLRPDGGSVSFTDGSGVDLTPSELSRITALMPQQFVAPSRVRVRDFLTYVAWLRAVPRRDRRGRVAAALHQVELADKADARLGSLSGGMVRRVLLAQALIASPTVLLLDEPTTGLDPDQRSHVRSLVADLARDRIVLLSSHILEDVALLASRTVMIESGRLCFDGPTSQLHRLGEELVGRGSALSPYEAAFLHLRGART